MVERAQAEGCEFDADMTPDEKLYAIEAFEYARNEEAKAKAAEAAAKAKADAEAKAMQEEINATSLASIAASMEYQNMLTLEDVE
jgi:hypothetical protein